MTKRKQAPPADSQAQTRPEKDLPFEEAIEQLEGIIDSIERGETGLERSIRDYERGMMLIRHCRSLLERAEQRVQELSSDALEGAAGKRDEADENEAGSESR